MNYLNENDNYKLDGGDLVFYSDSNNDIYSGGFSINSIMMKGGISPFTTLNKMNGQTGGNVSDLFKDLVVPTWLVSQEYKSTGGTKQNNKDSDEDSEDEIISDDLHDKLIDLVTVSDADIKSKKKQTRRFKNKAVKNKGTKRNK
jgi:hypothetical protein